MTAFDFMLESTFAWNELCILHCLYRDAVRRFTNCASSTQRSKIGRIPYTGLYVIYSCFFFSKYRV